MVSAVRRRSVKFSNSDSTGRSLPLFRGHGSNQWNLETTLERYGDKSLPLREYLRRVTSVRRYISNYEASQIPYNEEAAAKFDDLFQGNFPNYEYLAFLRHHGFPSPFLDWTESPYVAAFFAFREVQSGVKAVRVYQYVASATGSRAIQRNMPSYYLQGPFAVVHERHTTQQCWYTLCLKSDSSDEMIVCPHAQDFASYIFTEEHEQDLISHIDIRVEDRDEALADLFAMNITPYTLFRTVDSLVETAKWRVLGV